MESEIQVQISPFVNKCRISFSLVRHFALSFRPWKLLKYKVKIDIWVPFKSFLLGRRIKNSKMSSLLSAFLVCFYVTLFPHLENLEIRFKNFVIGHKGIENTTKSIGFLSLWQILQTSSIRFPLDLQLFWRYFDYSLPTLKVLDCNLKYLHKIYVQKALLGN